MSLEKVHPHSVRILPKTKSKHRDFFKPLFGKNAQPGTLKKGENDFVNCVRVIVNLVSHVEKL